VSISDARQAQFSAPVSWPANSAFLRLRAIGRIERSTMLVSDLDAAVLEEAFESVPMVDAVADRHGNRRFGGGTRELSLKPGLEIFEERFAFHLPHGMPLITALAADLRFDCVKPGNPPQRFFGNRRRSGLGNLIKPPPPVGP